MDHFPRRGQPAESHGATPRKRGAAGRRWEFPEGSTAPLKPSRYERTRDLPRLIAMWPAELARRDRYGQAAIVHRLHNALRAERRRALAGHWTYDLARHSQLLAAYRAEVSMLERLDAEQ